MPYNTIYLYLGMGLLLGSPCIAVLLFFVSPCISYRCAFVGFRELYRQDRVRLHIQFFLSLLLLSVVSIAWYLLVHHELLSNPIATESVVYRNPVLTVTSVYHCYFFNQGNPTVAKILQK